jgi:hypothetical protein
MRNVDSFSNANILLNEADELLEKGDVVQASEKYYKAAEEAIKLLVKTLNLTNILEKVKEEGYWSLSLLHDAVLQISEKLTNEVYEYWKSAIIILTANLSRDVLTLEVENVRKLVKLADKVANFKMN